MTRRLILLLAGLMLPLSAQAQTAAPKLDCFSLDQFNGWRAPDDKTVFIRVNSDRYYRLDLASSCPTLTRADAHLITRSTAANRICSATDWDLSVARSGPGARASMRCVVKAMTQLSDQDIAAIPKPFKP
jgi:hypothetical protein